MVTWAENGDISGVIHNTLNTLNTLVATNIDKW